MTYPHGYDTRQEGCPECNAVLEEMYAPSGSGSELPAPKPVYDARSGAAGDNGSPPWMPGNVAGSPPVGPLQALSDRLHGSWLTKHERETLLPLLRAVEEQLAALQRERDEALKAYGRLMDLMLDQPWHRRCEIIPQYMPPFPREATRPKVVVRFQDSFLRHSAGPKQGFFWDVYGDDFQNEQLAVLAIAQAPAPPSLARGSSPSSPTGDA